jgi:hypothetical protein
MAGLVIIATSLAGPSGLDRPIVATRLPTAKTALPTGCFDHAQLVRLTPDGPTEVLTPEFHSACDPDVSHDGQRLLFSARRAPESPWQVYELDLATGAQRQVTDGAGDCRSPLHLSRLFTLDSPEPWATLLYVGTEDAWNVDGSGRIQNLFNVRLDGTERRRVTANPAANLDPFQAADGRVLYASQRLSAEGPIGSRLFAVNLDGTDYEHYGAEQGRRFQRMPCTTADGLVVFVESDVPTPDGAGQLAAVKESRPHHSYRSLTGDDARLYLHPAPLQGSEILVARRDGRGGPAVLVRFDTHTGIENEVVTAPGYSLLQPKVLQEHARPDGRSTVVNTDFQNGVLFAMNCYDADARFAAHLQPGSLQTLRVIEGIPAVGESPAPLSRRLLGEVPIEADGSVNIEVPADRPLELQVLDANDMALATCGWIWVKQKENRGCIGCHEDPERTPENLFVQAVQKPSVVLAPAPAGRRSVGFRRDVMPILERRCGAVDCHGEAEAPWRAAKGGGAAEQVFNLLRTRYVTPGRARTSRLVWHLTGRNTARPWDREAAEPGPFQPMPPAKAAPLKEVERRTILEWIDLGAVWETSANRTSAEQ